MKKDNGSILNSLKNIALDILLVYIAYFICRVVFLTANYSFYEGKIFTSNFFTLLKGSLVFDTAGIIYMNLVFIVMAMFPIHIKEGNKIYGKVVKYTYVIFNTLGIIANLCDVVYFRYTGRRTTGTVFSEFSNET